MSKGMTIREAGEACKPRGFIRLEKLTHGSLWLRKEGNGVLKFYWRVTYKNQTKQNPIGRYDSSAPPKTAKPTDKGYSLAAARRAAEDMAAMHNAALDRGGYAAVLVDRKAEVKAREDEEAAKGHTLSRLFELYVLHLKERNAETAKQARNLFAKNVTGSFPQVAGTQANKVTTEQITEVLRPLIVRGHKTTARKLKAYLSSAYERGLDPESNAAVSEEWMRFKLKNNPVASIRGIRLTRSADKNPLSVAEMREYWRLINAPGREAAVLRLHLMLGGQRLEQFVRMRSNHIGQDVITLMDSKGRTGTVRPIYIPRMAVVDEALGQLAPSEGFAISVTPGKHLSPTTMRTWAKGLVRDKISGFELKRVRSGVTTLLTKLGIRKEVRDSLQSHDQTGVETKHYNMYDYHQEKQAALEAMYRFLASEE